MSGPWTPVGFVRCTRKEIRDDEWDLEESAIDLAPHLPASTIDGLETFSHVLVVYEFHRVDGSFTPRRHPRGNPLWPEVGIFAQRAKDRPVPLGVTVAAIARVEDRTLVVQGLDAIDGTPVLDMKPWMEEFGPRGPVTQPAWSRALMASYWSPDAATSDDE
jgi:tRNA (adenine37-N6)-methyltransferase